MSAVTHGRDPPGAMPDVHFRYPSESAATMFVVMTRELYPFGPDAQADGCLVRVPGFLWDRPLVPELAVGLGGRVLAGRLEGEPGEGAPAGP